MTGTKLRRFEAGDADWLVRAHAELYAREAGFDSSFGTLVHGIIKDFLSWHDPERERGFVAEAEGTRLGSIFCVAGEAPDLAKLRLFLLVPEARGRGLGLRLLDTCLGFARGAGYARIGLWTHESHREACALYARNGFMMMQSKPVRSFGVDLVEQRWERALDDIAPLTVS